MVEIFDFFSVTEKMLRREVVVESAYQTIQQVIMLYLDESIRIFTKYEASFRNIKLLIATSDNKFEGPGSAE